MTKQDEASRLAELIDEYWSIAYQQGLVYASHDDEQGSAGLCLHKINASIATLAKQQASPATQVAALTDEQIDAVSLAFWGGTQPGAMFNSFRAFARAILAEAGTAKGEI